VVNAGTRLLRDDVTDPVGRPGAGQHTTAVTRLWKGEHHAHTYEYNLLVPDTEPSSQWLFENPNVRLIAILTGGAQDCCHSSAPEVFT